LIGRWIDKHIDRQANRQIDDGDYYCDRYIKRQMDRWRDRKIDSWMDVGHRFQQKEIQKGLL